MNIILAKPTVTPTIRALAVLALSFFVFSCGKNDDSPNSQEISVRFPIPIIENGQAPFYLAEDRGYYKKAGLKVSFNMGSPDLNPVRMVAAGQDEFGVLGGPDTLLVARSRGTKLTAVSILHRNSNFPVILVKEDSPIKTVEDLNGKRVGFFYGHISTDVLRSFFKRAGITVEEVDIGFDYNALITGRVDAAWAFTVTAGIDLPAQGQPVRVISPQSIGINTHGYTIFVTDDYLRSNAEIVERFVAATLQGVAAALKDPNAAVKALEQRNPDLDPEISLQRQLAYNTVTTHEAPYYYGYVDEAMMRETYERLRDLSVLESEFDINGTFDPDIAKTNQPN